MVSKENAKERTWDEYATVVCNKFHCIYEGCIWDSNGFQSKFELNKHLLRHHWFEYILERQANKPLRKCVLERQSVDCNDCDKKICKKKSHIDRFMPQTQCGSCPSMYRVGCLYHPRKCFRDCPIIDANDEGMQQYLSYLHEQIKIDSRLTAPRIFFNDHFGEFGYRKFLDFVQNGDYDEELKNAFIICDNIYDPRDTCMRLYIVASKTLKLLYVGSCLMRILKRMKKHVKEPLHCVRLLEENDVQICVAGYTVGGQKFLKEKERMELSFIDEFDGCEGYQFVNVRRH